MSIVRSSDSLVHWQKWQPELVLQQGSEYRFLRGYMFGVKIQGFTNKFFPAVKVGGLEINISGTEYEEGDSSSSFFVPHRVGYENLSITLAVVQGDRRLELWLNEVVSVLQSRYNMDRFPSGYQPEEVEYFGKYRRDIIVHYLNHNLQSVRRTLYKKCLPIKMSVQNIDSLSSSLLFKTFEFNVMKIISDI